MATARETLQATLSETEYGALKVLAESTAPLSGRKVATALGRIPNHGERRAVHIVRSWVRDFKEVGKGNPVAAHGLEPHDQRVAGGSEARDAVPSTGSSPYSTGGGGVRLGALLRGLSGCWISRRRRPAGAW